MLLFAGSHGNWLVSSKLKIHVTVESFVEYLETSLFCVYPTINIWEF